MSDEPALTPLSRTESAILALVATGATNREIARERGITEATVKKHLTNINSKLGTGNRTEAFRRALEIGVIEVKRDDGMGDVGSSDVARRLAEELERTRVRSRRISRWGVGALTLAVVAGLASLWLWFDRGLDRTGIATTPPLRGTAISQPPLWVPAKSLPTPRNGLALVAIGDDVIAIGGEDAEGVLAQTLRFGEPGSPDWMELSDKPTAVRDIGAVEVGGEIVVPGGCDDMGRATDHVEVYSPAADLWRPTAPLPSPRCGYGLAALQGKVYLFGGRTSDDAATALDEVLVYDPGDDEWTVSEARLPDRRSDLGAAAFARTNRIHLVGGRDRSGNLERNHWIFRPFDASDPWDIDDARPLPNGRAGHAMTAVPWPFERIYIVGGGWDTRVSPNSLELDLQTANSDWSASSDLVGPTPYRGAALAHHGRRLFLTGGSAEGSLSARSYFLEPFNLIYFAP